MKERNCRKLASLTSSTHYNPASDELNKEMESSLAPPIAPTEPESSRIGGEAETKEEDQHEVNTTADLVAGWLGGAGKLTFSPLYSLRGLEQSKGSRGHEGIESDELFKETAAPQAHCWV